jgi:hypothetical protein
MLHLIFSHTQLDQPTAVDPFATAPGETALFGTLNILVSKILAAHCYPLKFKLSSITKQTAAGYRIVTAIAIS